jgi:hypothetical protein
VSVQDGTDQSPVKRAGGQRAEAQDIQFGDGNVKHSQFGGTNVEAGRDAIVAGRDGESYPRGLAEAILLSIDAVEAIDWTGLSRPVLDAIALLSPAGVPRELLYTAGREGILSRFAEPPAIDRALGQLADASLLTFSGDGSAVTAHRLVMRVARERRAHEGTLANARQRAHEAGEPGEADLA